MYRNEYVRYTCFFFICIFVILFPFVLHDRSLILADDGFNQSFPVFVYAGQWLRSCLQGEIRWFDFRLGLGDDVIHAMNWHGFGDITQLISVVIPYKYAEWGYSFVMLMKLWLCGITFLIYIKKYVQHIEYRIIGALLYSLNTFTLALGFNCWMFLAPMMTFPLILTGIDDIIENKKTFSKALFIGIFIQAMNGFYLLYMEAMMAILYFGFKEFVLLSDSFRVKCKQTIFDGVKIFTNALLAAGLGAPLLIPSILGYLQSSRTGRTEEKVRLLDYILYPFDTYRSVLSHILIPNTYRSIFTLGPIVLIGLLGALIHKKGKNREHSYLFVLLAVLYGIPFWGRMLNGFANSTDRWLFGLVLIAIVLAIIELDKITTLSRREIVVFWALNLVFTALYLVDVDWYVGKLIPVLFYCIMGMALPLLYNKRKQYETLILPFCCFLIIVNGLLIFSARELGGSGYSYGFKGRGAAIADIDQKIDAFEHSDEAFERKEIFATSLGASLVKKFYGTTEYLSMLNGNTTEFYRQLSISPGLFGATWVLKGLDGRTELEALCSVRDVVEYTGDNHELEYKYNEAYLPLGITYTALMNREQFDVLNPMEKQAALVKYLVLENEDVPYVNEVEQDIINANTKLEYTVSMENVTSENNVIYADENASINIYIDELHDWENSGTELYVQLQDMLLLSEGTADVWVGNKKIQLRNSSDIYYMGIDEFWVNVTELKQDARGYYFVIELPDNKCYSLKEINIYQHKIDYAAIEQRKKNSLEDLEIGINEISGKVESDESTFLLFSIPYSKGWKAYVDGVEQTVYKADVGFLAVELSEGLHTVVLKYTTPGLVLGCIVGGICVVILIIMCCRKYLRKQ